MIRAKGGKWLTAPAILYLAVVAALPTAGALYLSLTDARIGAATQRFVMFSNYKEVIADPALRMAIWTGLVFAACATAAKVVLGGTAAVVLECAPRPFRWLAGLMFLPLALPGTLVAVIWLWLFYDVGGLANYLTTQLALVSEPIQWLGQPRSALVVTISATVWRGFPLFLLAILAGSRDIHPSIREAAAIDGASAFAYWRAIALPHLSPLLVALVLVSFVLDLGEFECIYLITRGGPGNATHTAVTLAYEVGLCGNRLAAALALVISLLPLVVSAVLGLSVLTKGIERRWQS